MELNATLDRLEKYNVIDAALNKAKAKHPNYPVDDMYKQVAIMNEEAGEVTRAVLQYKDEGGSIEDVKKELIHTAAMCMRMLENL
jgi:NTP pyrophosphatase (non-canonical NTP hydrolase)